LGDILLLRDKGLGRWVRSRNDSGCGDDNLCMCRTDVTFEAASQAPMQKNVIRIKSDSRSRQRRFFLFIILLATLTQVQTRVLRHYGPSAWKPDKVVNSSGCCVSCPSMKFHPSYPPPIPHSTLPSHSFSISAPDCIPTFTGLHLHGPPFQECGLLREFYGTDPRQTWRPNVAAGIVKECFLARKDLRFTLARSYYLHKL